ncbi:MAG: ATP-binding cassette domain-containing protein [Promethearchaeota archaeon]
MKCANIFKKQHFQEIVNEQRHIAYKQQVLKIFFEKYKHKKIKDILRDQKHINDNFYNRIIKYLDITAIADRNLGQCSGGELQRFAIASVLIQNADCYLIDEPCTFLDVKKRIKLAELLLNMIWQSWII